MIKIAKIKIKCQQFNTMNAVDKTCNCLRQGRSHPEKEQQMLQTHRSIEEGGSTTITHIDKLFYFL